jgi:DNA ligase-1
LSLSPLIRAAGTWEDIAALRAQSRARGVEGLMLKALDSSYGTGRERGAWWKWKIDPYTFDAVMLYAHPGHGRRSNLYTDYTFGVWRGVELVPVAKAYSGLSNAEIAEVDRWIRAHTLEKFGPNRAVEQTEVFELAYEGIAASSRHKSGIALRFPRILRRRPDKPAAAADTLAALQRVLEAHRGDINPPPA